MKEGKLRKSRTAARGWVSRASKALQETLTNPKVTRLELQDAVDDFDKRLATLDEVQSLLELELNDEQELENEIEYAYNFRKEVRVSRIQATQKLLDLEECEKPSKEGSSTETVLLSNVKLPKLELPRFSGELTEWQAFWDRFVALVDESDIPVISKFCYLQSLLDGEAKSVIQG